MCGLERRMTTRAVPHECHTKVITAPLCAYLWVCVEGLSSFLPNVSYLQPPGWVHHLINRTWQPLGLRIRWVAPEGRQPVDAYGSRWNNTYSASAASSDDGRLIVVRLTSWAAMPIRVLLNGTTASSASSLRGSYVARNYNCEVPPPCAQWNEFFRMGQLCPDYINRTATPALFAPL